jgi:hypothetical protein
MSSYSLARPIAFAFVVATLASCVKPPAVSGGTPGTGGAGAGAPGGGAGAGGGAGGGASADGPSSGGGAPDFGFKIPDADPNADMRPANPNPTTGTGETNCGLQKFELQRVPPEIMLVLDRSSTMSYEVENSLNTRWVEVSRAVDQVLMSTDRNVLWGLKLFPTVEGCMVTGTVEAPVAAMNYMRMSGIIRTTTPNMGEPGTPMPGAIRAAADHLAARQGPNPRYLLLATDGLPNCGPNGTYLPNDGRDIAGPLQAIRDAAMRGIRTFVIGIAAHDEGPTAVMAMDMWAAAGGVPRPGMPRFYPVNNQAELSTALNDITVRVGTCVFPLSKLPPSPNDVAVDIDGRRIMRDPAHMNGWDYAPGGMSIEVFGPMCEQLKMGKAMDVQIIFGCPNMPIP